MWVKAPRPGSTRLGSGRGSIASASAGVMTRAHDSTERAYTLAQVYAPIRMTVVRTAKIACLYAHRSSRNVADNDAGAAGAGDRCLNAADRRGNIDSSSANWRATWVSQHPGARQRYSLLTSWPVAEVKSQGRSRRTDRIWPVRVRVCARQRWQAGVSLPGRPVMTRAYGCGPWTMFLAATLTTTTSWRFAPDSTTRSTLLTRSGPSRLFAAGRR